MSIIILITILCALLYFTYKVNGQEIFCPSSLLLLAYLLALVCCFFYQDAWELQLSIETILVILSVAFITVISDGVARRIFNKRAKYAQKRAAALEERSFFNIGAGGLAFFMIVAGAALLLTLRRLMADAQLITMLTQVIGESRAATYSTTKGGDIFSMIASQLQKIVNVVAVLFTYLLLQNIVLRRKKKNFAYAVIVALCIFTSLLSGARSTLLKTFLTGLAIYYFLTLKYIQRSMSRVSEKFVRKMLIAIPIVLVLFWALRLFMGRNTRLDSWNFMEYISFYIGGGIASLNDYFANPVRVDKMFGEETFAAIYSFLGKFISDIDVTRHLEFRRIGTINGNVYTAIRRYHNDFGLIGILLLQMLFSGIYSVAYYKTKKNAFIDTKKQQFSVMLYCFLYFPIVYHPIDDQLYSNVFSTTMLLNILMLWVCWKMFIREERVSLNRRRH